MINRPLYDDTKEERRKPGRSKRTLGEAFSKCVESNREEQLRANLNRCRQVNEKMTDQKMCPTPPDSDDDDGVVLNPEEEDDAEPSPVDVIQKCDFSDNEDQADQASHKSADKKPKDKSSKKKKDKDKKGKRDDR